MVLFVFVVMMLSMGPKTDGGERYGSPSPVWLGPAILTAVLIVELFYVVYAGPFPMVRVVPRPAPRGCHVAFSVPISSEWENLGVLLLGLIGAYHLAYQLGKETGVEEEGAHSSSHTLRTRDDARSHPLLLGLAGVLVRRDSIFVLLSLEVMLNAAGFAFVVAGARWREVDGQIMFLFILAVAASEVSWVSPSCSGFITGTRQST